MNKANGKWSLRLKDFKRKIEKGEISLPGSHRLKRELTLFDAAAIDIGAIIGAGIFVVIGVAASVAGAGLIISMLIAGFIAYLTALSYAELSKKIPKEGGEYQFAYQTISHEAGFVDGVLWSISTIISGAVVASGFAKYFVVLFPGLPEKLIAMGVIFVFAVVNILGLKRSSIINQALVVAKIGILLFFILYGINDVSRANFQNLAPYGWEGILEGAGIIFFAFAGFGRVATVAEEVIEPRKNIPKAILLALTVCTLLYFLTGFVTVGLLGWGQVASSSAPIAEAISKAGNSYAVILVAIGALAATSSVLLTQILGISRIVFSMARNKQMPGIFSKINPTFNTPVNAIVLAAVSMAILAYFINFKQIIQMSSFGLLSYYAITNVSAMLMKKDPSDEWAFVSNARAFFGFLACVGLMLFLAKSLLFG